MASPLTIDIRSPENNNKTPVQTTSQAQNKQATPGTNNNTGRQAMRLMVNQIATQLANASIQQGKQIINMSISNYGTATGNYLMQERLDNMVNAVDFAISTAVSTVSAFAINPILGGVSLGVQAVSQGINLANSIWNYEQGLKMKNSQAAFNSANLGLILTNGSR